MSRIHPPPCDNHFNKMIVPPALTSHHRTYVASSGRGNLEKFSPRVPFILLSFFLRLPPFILFLGSCSLVGLSNFSCRRCSSLFSSPTRLDWTRRARLREDHTNQGTGSESEVILFQRRITQTYHLAENPSSSRLGYFNSKYE